MACTLLLGGSLTWLVTGYQNPPIVYENAPFPTDQAVYAPGDTVVVHAEFCRKAPGPYTLHVNIENGETHPLPALLRGGKPQGCYENWTPIAVIPANYPPGKNVYLSGKSEYEVFRWLPSRIVGWESQRFTVSP